MAQYETTKDKFENMLVSKSQTIEWTPPKCVHLVFESSIKYMHIVYDNNWEVYPIACVHGKKEIHTLWSPCNMKDNLV